MTTPNGGNGRDHDRFRSLYEKYFRRLVRYFVRVFRVTEDDGKDLAQDTFVRFLSAKVEYRGEAEWAFLEKIARNVGFNRVRGLNTAKRGAVKPLALDDPETRLREQAHEPDYVTPIDDAAKLKRLQAEIQRLPPGQRQCLQLWLSDLKYEAIARVLGISLDAVKSRLRDAKNLLRERLGEETGLPEDES
jgi:RNA polymerase sigma-70 factor (ECF subfamily)